MITVEMLIGFLGSIIGFLVMLLLWNIKSWQKRHDMEHIEIDHKIDRLTDCISTNKKNIESVTARCNERCKQEDKIFDEFKQVLKELPIKISNELDKLTKIISDQGGKILVLQERLKQLDRRGTHDS